jgi:hypothetical protein
MNNKDLNKNTVDSFSIGGVVEEEIITDTVAAENNTDVNVTAKVQFKEKLEKIKAFLIKRWWLVLIAATVFVVLLVALFALVLLKPTSRNVPDYNNVIVKMEAPESLPKGTPGKWKITIENKEDTPIEGIQVDLDFDKSFEFSRAINPSPDKPEGNVYKISRLDDYKNGIYQQNIEFEGITKGNIDEEIIVKGTISYTPQQLLRMKNSGQLSKEVSERKTLQITPTKTRTTSARININMAPSSDTIVNNGEVEFTVNFENTSEKEIKDLRLQMVYPQGFNYTGSDLRASQFSSTKTTPDESNNIWKIDTFNRLSSQILKFRGTIQGSNNVRMPFTINMQIKNGDNWQTVATRTRDVTIAQKPLLLTTKVSNKDNGFIKPEDQLEIVIDYENQGSSPLKDVEIAGTLQDPAGIVDWTTASFSGGDTGNLDNRTFKWSGKNIPQLANLGVGVKGQLRYNVKTKPINDFIKTNFKQNDYIVIPNAVASAQNLAQVNQSGTTYKSVGDVFLQQTVQDITSEAEKQKAANRKVYKVTWNISTLQNQINQVEIRTKSSLPENSFVDLSSTILPQTRQSELSYSQSTGELVWKVGNIINYTGLTNPIVTISFNITTDNFEGTLFTAPNLSGTDDFTGVKLTKKGDEGRR